MNVWSGVRRLHVGAKDLPVHAFGGLCVPWLCQTVECAQNTLQGETIVGDAAISVLVDEDCDGGFEVAAAVRRPWRLPSTWTS